MATGDPYAWSEAQVAAFVLDTEAMSALVGDMPNAKLPELQALAHTLKINDVTGAVLLNGSVDSAFLKDDCGIRSLGMRSAVMHCIRKLKAQSISFNAGTSIATLDIPALPLREPDASATAPVPSLETDVVGQNVRRGEQEVRDEYGQKRRKLDLSRPAARPAPAVPPVKPGTFLRDSSLPLDSLFYGSTMFGQEIGELEPQDASYFADTDDCFQFVHPTKAAGEIQYVNSQMRHFLLVDSSVTFARHGHDAVAIIPFRESLLPGNMARSATVFQVPSNMDEAIAVRENAAFLSTGTDVDYGNLPQNGRSGEWDFLFRTWGDHKEDAVINPLGNSDQAEWEITSSLADEIARDEESQSEERGFLSATEIDRIVEQTITAFVDEWEQKNLQRLEKEKAWTVWKRSKRSRLKRDQLIAEARGQIANLDRRLERQKRELARGQYKTDRSLLALCEIMRTSVIDDREELKWKISVWQRRSEPYHVVQHGQSTTSSSTAKPVAANVERTIADPSDRFSVEPSHAPENIDSPDLRVFNGNAQPENHNEAAGGDDYVVENAGVETALDTSMTDFIDNSSNMVTQQTSPTSQKDNEAPLSTLEQETAGPKSPFTGICEPSDPDSGDQFPHGSLNLSSSQRFKTPQKKTSTTNSKEQPIEISSDSTVSSSRRIKKPSGASATFRFDGDPLKSTAAEVKSWEIRELAERRDAKRMVIKMLYEAGSAKRDALFELMKNLRKHKFREYLLDAMRAIKQSPDIEHFEIEDKQTPMIFAARVHIAQILHRPQLVHDFSARNIPWHDFIQDENQAAYFTELLDTVLRLKDGPLFVPTRVKKSLVARVRGTAVLSKIQQDSDSDESSVDTPSKKRKQKLAQSEAAKQSRKHQDHAIKRQEKFKAIQTQSSISQELFAMVSPDRSQSSIQINLLKDDNHDPIFVHKTIAAKMKDHQVAGVQFMWREITASGDNDAQGCVLAHTMGLGKTMQTITLLVAVNEAAQSDDPRVSDQLPPRLRLIERRGQLRMLIICPSSLLINWQTEIRKWAPQKLPSVWAVEASTKISHLNFVSMQEWYKHGGVLLIGYELFRNKVTTKEGQTVRGVEPDTDMHKFLIAGPDIVIADEAHKMKDEKSRTAFAASLIQTESRIALTGTPMSNDVQEIYAIISWVAPGYLGDSKWFNAQFALPIKQGNGRDSTAYERRKGLKKLAVLHGKIEPKVDRAGITVLRGSLGTKVEFVITLPLLDTQYDAYRKYVHALLNSKDHDEASQVTIFQWLQVLTLLTNHPVTFKEKLLQPRPVGPPWPPRKSRDLSPIPDASSDVGSAMLHHDAGGEEGDIDAEKSLRALGFDEECVKEITASIDDDSDVNLSAKITVLMDIVNLSRKCGDKVLIFSYFIPCLDYLERVFIDARISFGRIDGSVPAAKRVGILRTFAESKTDVLIISTKAGGVGLNIQTANRVIILDSHFNPSYEEQAIGRSYRLGQQKPVYVYRLMIGGTFEANIYDKQKFKIGLANRVVDKKNTRRAGDWNTREYLYEPKDVEQANITEHLAKDPEVLGVILSQQLAKDSPRGLIRNVETTETLMEEVAEPLTADEQREVDDELQINLRDTWRASKRGVPVISSRTTTVQPPPSTAPPLFAHQATVQPSTSSNRPETLMETLARLPSYSASQPPADSSAAHAPPPPPPSLPSSMPHGLPLPRSNDRTD